MNDYINIGLIQTTLDSSIAWDVRENTPITMTDKEGDRIWEEIKRGFIDISSNSDISNPQIVIIPELSLPLYKQRELEKICKKTGYVIIAGLDFTLKYKNKIANEAVVLIPKNWPNTKSSKSCNRIVFGKTYFSYLEKDYFAGKNKTGFPSTKFYILDAGKFGRIGIAICSDFFDIERYLIYKGKIHHMIVISHNMDVKSYYFLSEAISRLVFCNVVICNTGYYGGSIVFSPYEEEFRRYIYKHEGSKLFTSQILKLPVKILDDEQKNERTKDTIPKAIFKAQPPGYNEARLSRKSITKRL